MMSSLCSTVIGTVTRTYLALTCLQRIVNTNVMLMASKQKITILDSQVPVQTVAGLVARAGILYSDWPAKIVLKHPRLVSHN